jgi:HD-GYP domain-containing protein (c-di-GMP phosphodiesterase class II)
VNFLTPLRREEQLHCRRVSAISKLLAETSGVSSPEATTIAQSALLHDIGKSALPQRIFHTPEPLSPREQTLVKAHTTLGKELLEGTETILSTAAIVAYQHHEYLDGSGYWGLHGHELHPHTKLIAVVNTFDALTFRKASWDNGDVRHTLEQRAGTQLDADAVHLLLSNLDRVLDAGYSANAHSGQNTHF